jgi:hypothetical protein
MEQTMPDITALNELEIDFFILADRAESVNGKLYMMGGAWDRILVEDIKQPVILSFAVGILVPWNATNQTHKLEITIETADGTPHEFRVDASFNQGRQPWLMPGETQRIILAVPGAAVSFQKTGSYVAIAQVNGALRKRIQFHLIPRSHFPMLPNP